MIGLGNTRQFESGLTTARILIILELPFYEVVML